MKQPNETKRETIGLRKKNLGSKEHYNSYENNKEMNVIGRNLSIT